MQIRPETPSDVAAIEAVTVAAFGEEGESVRLLIELVRASEHFIPELSLVAELDGEVVGHIMLSRVFLRGESDRMVLSLAPVGVHPDHQNCGIGAALVTTALQGAREMGEDIVVLEGHPGYYPRFGFERGVPLGIDKPGPEVPDDAFMVIFLDDAARGTIGKIEYPPAFLEAGATGA